ALLLAMFGDSADKVTLAAAARAAETAYRSSASAVIGQNLRQLASAWVAIVLLQAPCALAMFCLGMVAGRRQLLRHIDRH
ncbi:hypothetical protein ABTE32_22840, partial [Acinetobacter baumannii]